MALMYCEPDPPEDPRVARAVFWACVVAFLLLVLTAGALDTQRLFENERKEEAYTGYHVVEGVQRADTLPDEPGCP